MDVKVELFLLALSLLFFFSILAGKASSRFGVPALLLFLAVGMLSGSDGLGIQFNNTNAAEAISSIALCIILFSGGMDTNFKEIKPVIYRGMILATVGVLLMTFITGLLVWWISGMTAAGAEMGILTSLLLASIMSSTDSASVFSILRSRNLNLRNNLRPLLELESGSNDPMAYLLVITFLGLIQTESGINYWATAGMLIMQLSIGGLAGYILGRLSVIFINRIRLGNDSLYPILVFTLSIFIFSITYFLGGNGYLAVYVAGLVIGNSRFVNKKSSLQFFDGIAWLSQLLMFLTLGLLVNPHELVPVIVPALIISFLMIFISRPVAVFLCLLPYRSMARKDKLFVSWVGLRGAVPIIFAIIPLAQDIPGARFIFNVVFFCTLVSLLAQGTSLAFVSRKLGLADVPETGLSSVPKTIAEEEIRSASAEIQIQTNSAVIGKSVIELPIPEKIRIVLIRRGDGFFVPKGNTVLEEGDNLWLLADDDEMLQEVRQNLKGGEGQMVQGL